MRTAARSCTSSGKAWRSGRSIPTLFHGAKYTPLYADAGREENIIAFSLSEGARSVIAVAPRLFSKLMEGDDVAPLGAKAWGEAKLAPAVEGEYVNVLTGERHEARGGHVGLAADARDVSGGIARRGSERAPVPRRAYRQPAAAAAASRRSVA